MTEDELQFLSWSGFSVANFAIFLGFQAVRKLHINFLDKSSLIQGLTETEFYFIGRKGGKTDLQGKPGPSRSHNRES